jgi:glutamyl-tRNA reductase
MYLYKKNNAMTTKQIKSEIQKLLDSVPENVLQDLLDYLKEAQKLTKDQAELTSHLRKIIHEDRELLDKLAQ